MDSAAAKTVKPDSATFRGDSKQLGPTPTWQLAPTARATPPRTPGALRGAAGLPGPGIAENQAIGPYLLLKELGRGGMGVVFKAMHTTLNREVALKVLLAGDEASEVDIRRFLREAEACAALKHPNIVPVHDIGQHAGKHYFSMEFVEGQTLLDWTRAEKRSVAAIVGMMRKVCEAIAYAHQRGIIHRDLKPHNVMVAADGEPRVMDFGLAKRLDKQAVPGAEKTVVGTIMGTPQYMSPEQAGGATDEIDTRSDVYALGVMLYEMIAGVLPLNADTLPELLYKIASVDPAPLREKAPDVPWELEVIVMKALAKEKAQRFQSAQELAEDLDRWERKLPIRARKASLLYRGRKFVQRHRTLSAIAATALVVLSAAGAFGYREATAHAREDQARRDAAVGKAEQAVYARELAQEKLAARLPALKPQEVLDELKKIDQADGEDLRTLVAAAEVAAGDDDWRVKLVKTREERVRNFRGTTTDRAREALGREAQAAQRQAEAAKRVEDAAAVRRTIVPAKIEAVDDAVAATRKLEGARDSVIRAFGLDENSAPAKKEFAELMKVGEDLAARTATLRRKADLASALQRGARALALARALRDQDVFADDEDARPDEVGLAYQRAAIEYDAALAIDKDNLEARAGLVLARLEDAKVLAERKQDFTLARRAAAEVEKLAPIEVAQFRADVAKLERAARGYEQALSEARAEKLRGNWGSALAGFRKALAIVPEKPDVELASRICEAHMRCNETRHLDELAILEGAASLAEKPEERAEIEREEDRTLAELVDLAERAIAAEDVAQAAALVDRVISSRPNDVKARRLRTEIGGRRSVVKGMIFVSSGAFRYSGAPDKETDVAAFLIGETEVTNADFAEWVAAKKPEGFEAWRVKPGTDDLPVAGVSWRDAAAYAAWRGARLPTDVEWEKAACWDRERRETRARPWDAGEWKTWAPYFDREGPKPVRRPLAQREDGTDVLDRSPCGAFDMYGNVHEWVADLVDGRAVARGGSYLSRLPERSAPTRRFLVLPDFRAEHIGFRIAANVPE